MAKSEVEGDQVIEVYDPDLPMRIRFTVEDLYQWLKQRAIGDNPIEQRPINGDPVHNLDNAVAKRTGRPRTG